LTAAGSTPRPRPPEQRHGRRLGNLRAGIIGRRLTGVRAAAGDFVRIRRGSHHARCRAEPAPVSRCVFELSTSPARTARCSVSRWTGYAASSAGSSPRSNPRPAPRWCSASRQLERDGAWIRRRIRRPAGTRTHPEPLRRPHLHQSPPRHCGWQRCGIKFNPVREVIQGRSVVVVDDSLVRGNTSKELVHMIRSAGAREVHLPLARPPSRAVPLRIDTPTREELIAATHSQDEIRRFLGVDNAGLSLARRHAEGGRRATGFCHACFLRPVPYRNPRRSRAAPSRCAADRLTRMSGPYARHWSGFSVRAGPTAPPP